MGKVPLFYLTLSFCPFPLCWYYRDRLLKKKNLSLLCVCTCVPVWVLVGGAAVPYGEKFRIFFEKKSSFHLIQSITSQVCKQTTSYVSMSEMRPVFFFVRISEISPVRCSDVIEDNYCKYHCQQYLLCCVFTYKL